MEEIVEEALRVDALLSGQKPFLVCEFVLEPAHHPEPPIDHDLQGVPPGNGRRVRGNEGDGLEIAFVGDVDRRCGSVAEAGHVGVEAPGPDHLAGLVRCGGNDGEALGDACQPGRLGRHTAQFPRGRNQFGEHGGFDREDPPLPVPGGGPSVVFVVEGYITHLGADGIHEPTREAMGKKARQKQVFVSPSPDIRLAGGDPVCLRLGLEIGYGIAVPRKAESQSPQASRRLHPLGAALVEPDDGRTEGLALGIHIDHGRPLGRQGHAGHSLPGDVRLIPELLAGPADG
jgi:hypothetical protein